MPNFTVNLPGQFLNRVKTYAEEDGRTLEEGIIYLAANTVFDFEFDVYAEVKNIAHSEDLQQKRQELDDQLDSLNP